MRTFRIELVLGNQGMVEVFDQCASGEGIYWKRLGSFSANHAALYVLMTVTNDVPLTFANADNFQRRFLGEQKSFPRIISSRDVFDWLGSQVSARI